MSEAAERQKFKELINLSNWQPFEDYVRDADSKLEGDIEKSLKYRRQLSEQIKDIPYTKENVRPRETEKSQWAEKLRWAEDQLFNSKVVGVDGTMSRFQLVSGTRCRIGVVGTTYENNRIEKVLFVSEREFAEDASSPVDHIMKLRKRHQTSQMVMRAVMAYSERELLLQMPQEWKLLQGDLLPYELRTGLGKLEALDITLGLGERLIEAKKVIAVTEDTSWVNLLHLGYALEKGQFIEADMDMKSELEKYLYGDEENDITPAHFNTEDKETFDDFIQNYAKYIKLGVYKTGFKPYIFYAHRDYFDEAAAIIMADSMNQPMRGYPLLLDYANNLAKGMLSQGDFQKQIMAKIAVVDPEELGFEMSARVTRRE